jgi:broad specificity phosphatase PhoE
VTELQSFVFIRHGETDWNRAGLFQGRSDIPLNETGREQARAASRQMKKLLVSRVFVSPLQRAIETAMLAFPSSSDLIEIEDALIECDFGSLDGKPIKETMLEHGISRKEQLAEILPADGESWASVLARGEALLDRLTTLQEVGSTIVLVGHDAVLQGISETLTGCWFDSKHGQPYHFIRHSAGWEVAMGDKVTSG